MTNLDIVHGLIKELEGWHETGCVFGDNTYIYLRAATEWLYDEGFYNEGQYEYNMELWG